MIKFIRIFLLVLIIIGLGLLATYKMWVPKLVDMIMVREQVPLASVVESNEYNLTDGRNCYAYSQVATKDAPYTVNEWLDVTIADGKVTGTKSGTQSGPDMTNGYEGTISGSVQGGTLNAVFSYTVEGSANREQEIYIAYKDGLEKYRYPLSDQGIILVPDLTKAYAKLQYVHIDCGQIKTENSAIDQ
ncbi:MAG: hypothetical protein KBC12_01610 [Candidatus Pacebacteria bacterium]|nr:hypothetical protein [Candidatus Paceibacterota bacterium]